MASYFERARSLLQGLLHGPSASGQVDASLAEAAGDNLVIAGGVLTFVDPVRAGREPESWPMAFTIAAVRNVPVDARALAVIERHVGQADVKALLPAGHPRDWLLEFLRPRPGLSRGVTEMRDSRLLARLLTMVGTPALPKVQGPSWKVVPGAATLASIESLEKLLVEKTLSGERFGSMLRELIEPEVLILAILLSDGAGSGGGQNVEEAVRLARASMDSLELQADRQQTVEFLVRNRVQMSQTAFRRDTNDPDVIRKFAALFSSEEQLKMLCLMTVADASAAGGAGFTPWKAELLWRLFVDAYNHLTMAYADEIIDKGEALLTTLHANRPSSMSEAELNTFLEGLPRRYLTLFDTDSIYKHVELCRNLGPDDIRFDLKKKVDLWELTVVTLDRPYLFSNICGVLSYLDLDILRGHALTSLTSVVIDVFQFIERSGALVESRLEALLSDVVGGQVDVTRLLREKERPLASLSAERTAPVIYFDNEASRRYTVLELVAEDSPGLLYRISRAISGCRCSVELVLISTEGHKAVDVFHLKKGDAKLADSDQLALTEKLEEALR